MTYNTRATKQYYPARSIVWIWLLSSVCVLFCYAGNNETDIRLTSHQLRGASTVPSNSELPSYNYNCKKWNGKKNLVDELNIRKIGYTFLHPGKGGGGTIFDRLDRMYKFDIRHCHPFPCSHVCLPEPPVTPDYHRITFVAVRDPIDRFVSAFYYMMKLQCHPTGETREPTNKPNLPNHSSGRWCYTRDLFTFILNKYDWNVNGFAEALCSDDPNEAKAAKGYVEQIVHMKDTLSDWVPLDNCESWLENIVPIVTEKNYDLNQMIDEAVQWTQHFHKFESDESFAARQEFVYQMKNPILLWARKEKRAWRSF